MDEKEHWIQSIKNLYQNFLSIRNHAVEKQYLELLDHSNQELETKNNRFKGFLVISDSINGGFGQYLFIGILILGSILIYFKQINVSIVIAIMQVSNMVIHPIFVFATLRNRIQSSKYLFDEIEKDHQQALSIANRKSVSLQNLREIRLDHLTFTYNDHPVLKDLNFTFEQGKKYLIIGDSGQGKSTLMKLIAKQIDSQSIFANGIPYEKIAYDTFYRFVSYLPQKGTLMPITLKDNILLFKNGSIESVLEQVQLTELDSRKNEIFSGDEIPLSGGQIQRILFAREFNVHKPWLLLDEAFSSIDTKTSLSIEEKILKDPDITIISISHTLQKDLLPLYDAILEIKNHQLHIVNNKY